MLVAGRLGRSQTRIPSRGEHVEPCTEHPERASISFAGDSQCIACTAPMIDSEERLLRTAFLAGAVTDAAALLPMLSPSLAGVLWGFHDVSGAYRFAMGYGASLMFGWTILLLWAARRPLERRFVALLTVVVIYGLLVTEVVAVRSGTLAAWRMVPTWCLQAALLGLFAGGYHHRALRRWAATT